MYTAFCSPARDESPDAPYHAWGHSLIVDPMGRVLAQAGHGDEVVYADLDGADIARTRVAIPLPRQRRFDVYPDVSRGPVRWGGGGEVGLD